MTDIAMVRTTFAAAGEAERLSGLMIEQRLAACVTLTPGATSIYRWAGGVDRAEEVVAVFKTTAMLARRLIDQLTTLHSYEVPAFETWIAETDEATGKWILDSVR